MFNPILLLGLAAVLAATSARKGTPPDVKSGANAPAIDPLLVSQIQKALTARNASELDAIAQKLEATFPQTSADLRGIANGFRAGA
jgi:hypothetical protein